MGQNHPTANMEMYLADNCPKCNKKNYWYAGDLDDTCGIDPDGVVCWSCKKMWLLPESDGDNCVEGSKKIG